MTYSSFVYCIENGFNGTRYIQSAARAYRLDVGLIEGLKRASRRAGMSENSFVQNLLAQRVKAGPLINAVPHVLLSRRTLLHILGSTNPDGLEMVGLELGKRNFALVRELYESVGKELGFSEFLVEILDKEAQWFEVEGAEDKPDRLTLRHECGMKWSLFLGSYLTSAFGVVSHENAKMTLNESYVSLELPTSRHW